MVVVYYNSEEKHGLDILAKVSSGTWKKMRHISETVYNIGL